MKSGCSHSLPLGLVLRSRCSQIDGGNKYTQRSFVQFLIQDVLISRSKEEQGQRYHFRRRRMLGRSNASKIHVVRLACTAQLLLDSFLVFLFHSVAFSLTIIVLLVICVSTRFSHIARLWHNLGQLLQFRL